MTMVRPQKSTLRALSNMALRELLVRNYADQATDPVIRLAFARKVNSEIRRRIVRATGRRQLRVAV